MRKALSVALSLAVIFLSPGLGCYRAVAAMVDSAPLTPAIGMMQTAPVFQNSVLLNIGVVSMLSHDDVPNLSPIMTGNPTGSDPWDSEAKKFVGSMLAHPGAIAAHREALLQAFGTREGNGIVQILQKAADRFHSRAITQPKLAAQLKKLRKEFDINDARAVQNFGARLNALIDNSKQQDSSPQVVTVAGPVGNSISETKTLQASAGSRSQLDTQSPPPVITGVIVDGEFPVAALKTAFEAALDRVGPPPSGVELRVLNSPMWGDNPQIRIRVGGRDVYWNYLYNSEADLIRVRHPLIGPLLQVFHRKPSDDLSKRFEAALMLAREAAVRASKASAKTLSIASDGKWTRFITRDGFDINLQIQRGKDGTTGSLVLGRTGPVSGDSGVWKGGAFPHVLNASFDSVQEKPGKMILYGQEKAPFSPNSGKLVLTFSSPMGRDQKMTAISYYQKSGWSLFWKKIFSSSGNDFISAPVDFDRTPITGEAAKEIYALLKEGLDDLDINGADFRGLRLAPYFTQAGRDNYEVSFDQIAPAQLIDALNGLKSLGLRPSHPIFERMPAPIQYRGNVPQQKDGNKSFTGFQGTMQDPLRVLGKILDFPEKIARRTTWFVSRKTHLSPMTASAIISVLWFGAVAGLAFILSAPSYVTIPLAWEAMAFLSVSQTLGSKAAQRKEFKKLSVAVDAHRAELMSIRGVVAIRAIPISGEDDDAHILIEMTNLDSENLAQLPKSIEGFGVETKIVPASMGAKNAASAASSNG